MQERTSIGQTPSDDVNDKDAPITSPAPSEEKIAILLGQVSCFTTSEPPSTSIDDFFPLTSRFFINMPGDPPITDTPRLPHGTLKFVIFYLQLMQQYTVVETTEVVRLVSI